MTDAEKLKRARNLIRFIVQKCQYKTFETRLRDDDIFVNRVKKDGIAVGVFKEHPPFLFEVTKGEFVQNTGPRHRPFSQRKHSLK